MSKLSKHLSNMFNGVKLVQRMSTPITFA